MTFRKPVDNAVATAVSLALGAPCANLAPSDWSRVYVVAGLEKLAALAWLRSGEVIRSLAPSEVVDRWRAHVVSAIACAERQSTALVECVSFLEQRGVEPVVLKGLPLAWRLYADIAARDSVDLDLWVSPAQRAEACVALRTSGWNHDAGMQTAVDSFSRDGIHLELHSRLFWDPIAHSALPEPEGSPVTLPSGEVPAHSGALLPVHLAANLAKHALPPLRGWIDLHTLWQGLEVGERAAALAIADELKLARYLHWGLARASSTVALAGGDGHALTKLGINAAVRVDIHPYLRAIALSATVLDALRAVGAAFWPRPERRGSGALFRVVARRVKKPIVRTLRPLRRYA